MKTQETLAATQKINEKLQEAIALHQAGQLNEAEIFYKELLSVLPFYLILGNLGTIELQKGNFNEALKFYAQAIAINANYAAAYSNSGNVLKELTRFDEALTYYGKAIELNPNYVDAYSNRGITLHHLNHFDEALKSFDQAILLNSNYAEAHFNKGITLHKLTHFEEALASFQVVIALDVNYVEAYYNQGNAFHELKQFEDALRSYDQAIVLRPQYADAFYSRGNAFYALKRLERALSSYNQAIAFRPNYANAYYNRGNLLNDLKRFNEAIASYDQALTINPQFAESYSNRGCSLQEQQRFEEALISYDHAIALNPNYAEAYFNRGCTLQKLKRLDEALNHYEKVITIKPQYADAHFNKSFIKILLGDYEEGWRLYEWRWKSHGFTSQLKHSPQPVWLGEQSLKNKTIVIYPEQGFGDYIQFIRYAPKLEQLGARVILEVPVLLMPVVSTLEGQFTFFEKGKELPDFDYHCPVMSLPHAFKTTVDTIPNQVPFFNVNLVKKQTWQARLGEKSQRRVGLVWSGSTQHKNDHNRSIPIHLFQSLFNMPVVFHCLQKEIREDDTAFLASQNNIHNHIEFLDDFSDTAALIDAMDLVISVDTSVAHLAGALGKETWILLPYSPDYRWMLETSDSPWYPTAKLFRQSAIGEWGSAINDIKQALQSR